MESRVQPSDTWRISRMRIQLLRPESLTPIAIYLDRSAAAPASFQPQFDLTAALLDREREYQAMYLSLSATPVDPRPRDDSPFRPYDLTPDAAEILSRVLLPQTDADLLREPMRPNDLFGLKNEVAGRLAAALCAVEAHRMGWVLAAKVWHDLCSYGDAVRAGQQAADLDASSDGLALARSAALAGAHMASIGTAAGAVPDGERIADAIEARARRERPPGRGANRWRAADRKLDDWLRSTGVAVRRRARRSTAAQIRDSVDEIDQWLDGLTAPYEGAAEAYSWLRVAAEEIGSGD